MAQSVEVISHWHHSVETLSTSVLGFYESVEKTLKEKEVPDLRWERTIVSERGILSAKREYLRITYGRLSFDICGAPFGRDFFFSWWLVRRTPGFAALWGCAILIGLPFFFLAFVVTMGFVKGVFSALVFIVIGGVVARGAIGDGWAAIEDAILAMPVIGFLYRKFVNPVTYYSEDTRLMFEDTIHRTVTEIVAGILTLNKLPQIPPEQLKPQSRNAFA